MDLLDDVKSINIKSLIEKETKSEFNRANILAVCPFCGSGKGKNKSSAFSVNKEKNYYKCFSCGSKGSTIDFMMNLNQTWKEKDSIKYLCETYLNSRQHVFTPAIELTPFQKTIYAIKNNSRSKATLYLQSRNIDTLALPKTSYYYDSHSDAVVFLDSRQKLINRRMINPASNMPKAKNTGSLNGSIFDELYNSTSDTVYLHEGIVNALSMPKYSSIALFSTENKIRSFNPLNKYIENKHVILAFDNDDAGNRFAEYYNSFLLSNRFDIRSLSRLIYPPGKDANDLLIAKRLDHFLAKKANYSLIWEDITSTPIPMDSEDKTSENDEFYFYKEDGCYVSKESFRGKPVVKKLSNFLMEIIYHLVNGTKDSSRIIKFQRYSKEIIVEELYSSELNLERFKKIIRSISGKGLSFFGSTAQLEHILSYLQDQEERAEAITQLGYQSRSGNYCFADAIITNENKTYYPDKLGIADCGENSKFYLAASSKANLSNDAYLSERKFTYKEGTLNFQNWSDHIYKAYGMNGAIGISFIILALFRDFIIKITGFFPFLFLFGDQGAGKSNFVNFFLHLFGEPGNGISLLNSTNKGFSRSLTQRKNALYYLKEYTNAIDKKTVDVFKTGYDGELYTMAQKSNDSKTITLEISSACMVDGNELPTSEAALFARMIVLHFESNNFSEESTRSYKTLLEHRSKGFGQITREILRFRSVFIQNYNKLYEGIFTELKSTTDSQLEISDRQLRHIALILTPVKLLQGYLSFPMRYEEFSQEVIENFKMQSEMGNEIKDVSIFWEAIAFKLTDPHTSPKENVHFQKDPLKEILYLKFRLVYPFYVEYVKKNNLRILDSHSLKELITSSGNKTFIPNNSQQARGGKAYTKKNFGSCYRFKYETTPDQQGISINGIELNL
jgi:hypothetical protein